MEEGLLMGPLVLGGTIGVLAGASYFAYTDYVHFHIKTNFVGPSNDLQRIALEKANYIFREYAKEKFKNKENEVCDQFFTYNLFVYPVKAADGKIYEHADIYHYITENYPAAVQDYERNCRRFPNDPTLVPPSSSPVRSGDVRLDNLRLHTKTMEKISKLMAQIFKDLKRWESQVIQKTIDDHYDEGSISGIPGVCYLSDLINRSNGVTFAARSADNHEPLNENLQQNYWSQSNRIDREVSEENVSMQIRQRSSTSLSDTDLDLESTNSLSSVQFSLTQPIISRSPQFSLNEEEISSVDERALALKFCTQQPLSLGEIFVIKQLFHYYIVQVRERDKRIYKAISIALFNQLHTNIISVERYAEEVHALSEWYKQSKELYI